MTDQTASPDYWNYRYIENNIPWDIGGIAPIIKKKLDSIEGNKAIKILIPGAGLAHEAAYLHRRGFSNVFVCDWAEAAFDHLREQCPDFPEEHLLIGDFFDLDIKVDLIIEQTFFCAIPRRRRKDYAQKAASLLNEGGQLIGLLFSSEFEREGPPHGGCKEEYIEHFIPYFDIITMEESTGSIKPRMGNELYLELRTSIF